MDSIREMTLLRAIANLSEEIESNGYESQTCDQLVDSLNYKELLESSKHIFTPSIDDKDFCSKCGSNFRNTNMHYSDL